MMNRKTKKDGFTLLEVLVAVSIMSISAVVAMQVISLGLKNVSKSRSYSYLVKAAENEMEKLLLKDELEIENNVVIERDDYRVRYSVIPIEDVSADDEESKSAKIALFDMYEIYLTVFDNNPMINNQFTLSALKLLERIKESE